MTRDPLLDLRLDTEPVDPDPAFRASLRGRLERALTRPDGGTMTTRSTPVHPRTMTPYLCCRDARAAIDWYRDAFGAELVGETYPMGPDDDRVGHAELRLGANRFFLSDEWVEGDVYSPATRGGPTTSFVLEVPDVDRAYDHAISLGATVVQPVADQPYGMRAGWLLDPFGHRWSLGSPLPGADA